MFKMAVLTFPTTVKAPLRPVEWSVLPTLSQDNPARLPKIFR
jgi:hypothetical protein